MSTNNTDSEYYGRDLVMWCNVSNICNMLAKNNSDSEYYGRNLVTWCNVYNISAKNNSDNEYYGRDLVTWCNICKVCNIEVTNVKSSKYFIALGYVKSSKDLIPLCAW